jgi:hypothetical protein
VSVFERVGGMMVAVLALAACHPIVQNERTLGDAALDTSYMQLGELETLLWPKTPEHWRPLSEHQQLALEDLVSALFRYARRGGMTAAQDRRVTALATEVGLELHSVVIQHEGRIEPLWVLVEPQDDRRGRGSYLFRLGEFEPDGTRVEYLLQAPHSRFDKHTGIIALSWFVEADTRMARALFVNSVHRYAQADGTRGKREPVRDNPADAAHREDHPIARATARVLREQALVVVQLHGFQHRAEAHDPDVIVGSGRQQPTPATGGTLDRLRMEFPELTVAHFGVDTSRLGGTTNVQGHAARHARRCFVHIEASELVREYLRSDRATRRRFAQALFGGRRQEFRRGCR